MYSHMLARPQRVLQIVALWCTCLLCGAVGLMIVHVCSLEVKEEDGKLQGVEWTGNSRWMPVTIGLVGPLYEMQAIGPTLRLTSPYMVSISQPNFHQYLILVAVQTRL